MTAFKAATNVDRRTAATRRTAGLFALVAGATLVLTGCSAGQISQTAMQVAAVNGNSAEAGDISLRNVHVIFPRSEEFSLDPGGNAELGFFVINNSPSVADRLVSITTPNAASVTIDGGTTGRTLEPQKSVAAGVSNTLPNDPSVALLQTEVVLTNLGENVRPGLTIPVTFSFEKAGDVEVNVPIDAGATLPRSES